MSYMKSLISFLKSSITKMMPADNSLQALQNFLMIQMIAALILILMMAIIFLHLTIILHLLHYLPGERPYDEPIQIHYLGLMNIECSDCYALHFDCEKISKSTRAQKCFVICCLKGKVQLPTLPQWPQELQRLYENNQNFVHNIRQYNNTFAFTSLRVELDHHTVQG